MEWATWAAWKETWATLAVIWAAETLVAIWVVVEVVAVVVGIGI